MHTLPALRIGVSYGIGLEHADDVSARPLMCSFVGAVHARADYCDRDKVSPAHHGMLCQARCMPNVTVTGSELVCGRTRPQDAA